MPPDRHPVKVPQGKGLFPNLHRKNQPMPHKNPSVIAGMARLSFWLLTLAFTFSMRAQDITGQWNGVLSVQGIQLRLVFHVSEADNGYTATMDSPDQGAAGIPVTRTNFTDGAITFEVANLDVQYTGNLEGEGIKGTFTQRGMAFPMDLSREETEIQPPVRPQEPVEPFPYKAQEVTFKNPGAGITLAGTLTLPQEEGPYPAVVLISGSGPQNRNEELLGHKPFLVIADYLTRNGIAVLRFDDRGTAQSEGDFSSATSADFATDVASALAYLQTRPEIDQQHIGLVGHSEGGLIAPMVAAGSPDIAFIVLLAGPGISGGDILMRQTELISRANGMEEENIKTELELLKAFLDIASRGGDLDTMKASLRKHLERVLPEHPELVPEGMAQEAFIDSNLKQVTPWMAYFLNYDPVPALQRVSCPVLALNGAKDLQVPAKVNLDAIRQALDAGGNKRVTTLELPNLNHLFQECETGSPSEYATIEETFSPRALEAMGAWIRQQTQ